jgi:hypothetical protein
MTRNVFFKQALDFRTFIAPLDSVADAQQTAVSLLKESVVEC